MSFTAWSSSSSAAKPLRCKMQMLEVWKCFLVAEHPRGHGWLNTDVAIFHMRCHLWNIFSVCGDYVAEKKWALAGGAVLTFFCVNERKSSSWLWRWIYAGLGRPKQLLILLTAHAFMLFLYQMKPCIACCCRARWSSICIPLPLPPSPSEASRSPPPCLAISSSLSTFLEQN